LVTSRAALNRSASVGIDQLEVAGDGRLSIAQERRLAETAGDANECEAVGSSAAPPQFRNDGMP
jgi:hypothetical protein